MRATAPARDGPTRPSIPDQIAEIACHARARSDWGLSAAIDAAGAQQPFDRTRAAGNLRRRNRRHRSGRGEIARRVPERRGHPQSPRQPVAVFLRAAGTAAGRRRSRARQFRPDTARFAVSRLGMDQPKSVADHDARLRQVDERADRLRQPAGSPGGHRRVPHQGRQIARGHACLAGRRRSGPRQARDLHCFAGGLWRRDQDTVRAACTRCAGEV